MSKEILTFNKSYHHFLHYFKQRLYLSVIGALFIIKVQCNEKSDNQLHMKRVYAYTYTVVSVA